MLLFLPMTTAVLLPFDTQNMLLSAGFEERGSLDRQCLEESHAKLRSDTQRCPVLSQYRPTSKLLLQQQMVSLQAREVARQGQPLLYAS